MKILNSILLLTIVLLAGCMEILFLRDITQYFNSN